jgi:hypothetical protein
MKKIDGIDGVDGREPVGAVVSIGIKDKQRGFPTETDRFHIVQPRECNNVREPHPAFASFNSAPAEHRKVIRGNLIHATRQDCFEYRLRAQVIKSIGAHPNRRPCCEGDGKRAIRWSGDDADSFMEIQCPNERCEYRQTQPATCKPFARFLFRLRWKDASPMPTPLCKFTTGSWNTVNNLLGFFKYVEKVARELGIKNHSLFGMPFMLTLTRQTKPSLQRAFPVVTITPEQDPVEFYMQQRERIAGINTAEIAALPDMQEPDIVAADYDAINVITGAEK